MNSPTIAVALPVYNGADYVRKAIESVLGQEHPADEIVIVDDASTDRTPEILRSYDGRARVERLDQRVLAPEAWNTAVRKTTSEFVLILAHDDLLHPSFLKKANVAISDHELDLFISANEIINDQGKVIGKEPIPDSLRLPGLISPPEFLDTFTRKGQFFLPSAAVMGRRLFDRVGGFDERIRVAYDWDFYLRAAPGSRIYMTDEILMSYRVHESQSIAGHTRVDNGDSDLLFQKLPQMANALSEAQKRWLVENMCSFRRRFATGLVLNPQAPPSEVVSTRRLVARQLYEWRQATNEFAKYVSMTPTQWRQRLIWSACRHEMGVQLVRLALDVSGQMPRPRVKAAAK